MRFLFVFLAFAWLPFAASAQSFQGRSVEVIDGRSNTAAPAPLIIAMHGFLGTSRSMRTKTSFQSLSATHGFIVVYPNGVGRRWNDGRSSDNPVDDVAYLSALISSLVAEGRADPNRVFLAGHSNGGGMAMRMACDQPGLIAGVAVIATKVPTNYQCGSGRPVPAIFFHGSVDPVAPPEGRPNNDRLGGTLSAEATLALWSRRNGCRGIGATQTVDQRRDRTSAEIIQYASCRAPLTYVLIEGHGHGWPGAGPRLRRLQGPATREIDAAALSWWFFSNL